MVASAVDMYPVWGQGQRCRWMRCFEMKSRSCRCTSIIDVDQSVHDMDRSPRLDGKCDCDDTAICDQMHQVGYSRAPDLSTNSSPPPLQATASNTVSRHSFPRPTLPFPYIHHQRRGPSAMPARIQKRQKKTVGGKVRNDFRDASFFFDERNGRQRRVRCRPHDVSLSHGRR